MGCAIIYKLPKNGGLAQLVRASASHAEGRRFESAALHQQNDVFRHVVFCRFRGRTRIMSESHAGGFRLPVQKLADTLIFAVPRKAKMQASPPLSTNKNAFCQPTKGVFYMICSAAAKRDACFASEVHLVCCVPCAHASFPRSVFAGAGDEANQSFSSKMSARKWVKGLTFS